MTDDPYGDDPTRRYPITPGPPGREPAAATRRCPRCNSQVSTDTQFCPSCGEDLRPKKASAAPMWIACILALLLAAAVVALIAETTKKNGTTKTVVKHVKGASTHSLTTDRHTTTVIKTQTVRTPAHTVTRPAHTVTVTKTAT